MPETDIPMTELASKNPAGHQNLPRLWNKSSLESCYTSAQHSEEEDKHLENENRSPHQVIASHSSRTSTGDAMQREYDRLTGNSKDNLNDSASQSAPEACDFTGSSDQYALLFLVRDRWLDKSGAEHNNDSVNVSKEKGKEKGKEAKEET